MLNLSNEAIQNIQTNYFGYAQDNMNEDSLKERLRALQKETIEILERLGSKRKDSDFTLNLQALAHITKRYPFLSGIEFSTDRHDLVLYMHNMPASVSADDTDTANPAWHRWIFYQTLPMFSYKAVVSGGHSKVCHISNETNFAGPYKTQDGDIFYNSNPISASLTPTHPHTDYGDKRFTLESCCVGDHGFRGILSAGLKNAPQFYDFVGGMMGWLSMLNYENWYSSPMTPQFSQPDNYLSDGEPIGRAFMTIRKLLFDYWLGKITPYEIHNDVHDLATDTGLIAYYRDSHGRKRAYLETYSLHQSLYNFANELDRNIMPALFALHHKAFTSLLLWGHHTGQCPLNSGVVSSLWSTSLYSPYTTLSTLDYQAHYSMWGASFVYGDYTPKTLLNLQLAAPAVFRAYARHKKVELPWIQDYLPEPDTELPICESMDLWDVFNN